MDIPINAEVECTDARCGRSTTVILDSTTETVTHVVVAESGCWRIEPMVPLDQVVETTPTTIRLRASAGELAELDPFIVSHFIGGEEPYEVYDTGEWLLWPYAVPEGGWTPVAEDENIPPGELAIHR